MAIVIGVGFRQETTDLVLQAALQEALDRSGENWPTLAAVATTARRCGHPALVGLTVPVEFHDPATLAAVPSAHPGAVVAALAGTASVAEAAALLSSGYGELLAPKRCANGVCTAVTRRGSGVVS